MNLKQHCTIDLLKHILTSTIYNDDQRYLRHLNFMVKILQNAPLKEGKTFENLNGSMLNPVFTHDALYSISEDDDLRLILVSEFKNEYIATAGYFDFIVSAFHYDDGMFKPKPYQACIYNDGFGTGIKVGSIHPRAKIDDNDDNYRDFRHDVGLAICNITLDT